MAERVRKIESDLSSVKSDVRDINTHYAVNSEKLDLLIKKFDDLPKTFLPRSEFNIYMKIAGFVAGTLLVATVALLFQVFKGGI